MARWEGPGGRDSCLPAPRQVPRAPGGGRVGGRRASHEAVAWPASALLFTSWEGKQEEVPGSLRAAAWPLASWPVG